MSAEQLQQTNLLQFIRTHSQWSRRDILSYITQKKTVVNGQIITDTQYPVTQKDSIVCNGQTIKAAPFHYYKFNKPPNVISSYGDPKGRPTIRDFVTRARLPKSLKPAGRLDKDTTGLLLFTNNGDLIQRLMHPSFEIKKQYL